MFKLILITFFVASHANAFIIADKNYRLSDPESTSFKISSEGCAAAGISDAILKDAMERAAEIWNDAPESRLKIKIGSKSSTSVSSSTVPKGEVIIGCAALGAGSIAGVTNQDKANGSAKIKMNSDFFSGAQLVGFIGTVVHEFGHAVGLTHSKDPASVMTYESNGWNYKPSYLAQDDVDGVVYLYPNEKQLGGLMGSCNSYAADGKSSTGGMGLELILGFFGLLLIWKMSRKFLLSLIH
jgi:hypothetical protein